MGSPAITMRILGLSLLLLSLVTSVWGAGTCSLTLTSSSYYNYLDEMATSSCVGMSVGHGILGHITAIRRACSNPAPNCDAVCAAGALSAGGVGTQSKPWKCFDSLHVYKAHPRLADNAGSDTDSLKIGPVIYRYNNCTHTSCGPNYCCCVSY